MARALDSDGALSAPVAAAPAASAADAATSTSMAATSTAGAREESGAWQDVHFPNPPSTLLPHNLRPAATAASNPARPASMRTGSPGTDATAAAAAAAAREYHRLREKEHERDPDRPQPKWRGQEDLFLTMRHRLDLLGYREYLHKDSVDLVQRLLVDLVQTTESARSLKNQLELAVQEKDAAAEQVRPLRQEIARLTGENNHLHADLVAIADERDAREKRMHATARKLEAQMADMRFMTTQFAHRVETEQRRADDARNKVDDVLARVGGSAGPQAAGSLGKLAAAANKADKAERMLQRLQKIDIETGLEPIESAPVYFAPPDPAVADIVQLAEGQIETLAKANKELESKATGLETEIQNTREQLAKREREIQRLGVQLEIARSQQFGAAHRIDLRNTVSPGGSRRSPIKGSSRTAGIVDIEAAKDRIEQLEIQIEYLQEHIDGLEKDLATHESERDTVQTAFITERDRLAAELNTERERTAGLLQNLSKLENMVNDLSVARAEASDQYSTKNTQPNRPTTSNPAHNPSIVKHLRQISDLTDKLKTTQQKLELTTKRLNQTITEKQRIAKDLERIKAQTDPNANANTDVPAATAAATTTTTADSANTSRQGRVNVSVSTRDRDSPTKVGTIWARSSSSPSRATANDKDICIRDLELAQMDLETRLKTSEARTLQLESTQSELETYRAKLSKIQKEYASLESQLVLAKGKLESAERFSQELMQNQRQALSELSDAQRERDDLLRALERFGEQVEGLHARVQAVTADRDNMARLYDQVNREVARLRSGTTKADMLTPPQPLGHPTNASQPTTEDADAKKRAEDLESSERRLKSQVHVLEQEIEKLQRDLEATVLRQKEAGATASEALGQFETEIDRLKRTLTQTEQENKSMQDDVQKLRAHVEQVQDEKMELTRELERAKLRITQVEMDRERDAFQTRDLRSKLGEVEAELAKVIEDRDALRSAATERDRLVADQRHMLAEIDRERDGFQADLDRKAEHIIVLTEDLARVRADAAQAAQDVVTLREQFDATIQSMNQQDRELGSLQRQLDQAVQERDHFEANAQRNAEESRNLSSDLAAVTRENQILNTELLDVSIERDRLKTEVAECDRQLQYLDDLIQMKDQEKENIAALYRKLAGEHERLDKTLQASGDDVNNMKMDAIMRDQRVQQLQKALDDAGQQITQYKIDLGVFEKQASNLSRALATAERTVKHLESEKARHAREMTAARDLAHTLGRSKDDMQRQMTAVALENEQLMNRIRRFETDIDTLGSQLRAEQLKAERLEHMVATERTRNIHTERSAVEIQASKGSHEEQLQRLNKEQALTIESLTTQLQTAQTEIAALRSRIESMQKTMRKQADDVAVSEQSLVKARATITELQGQVNLKEKILQDFLDLRKDGDSGNRGDVTTDGDVGGVGQDGTGSRQSPMTPFERKLALELQSTASQMRKYEARIVKQSKRHEDKELLRRLTEPSADSHSGDGGDGGNGGVKNGNNSSSDSSEDVDIPRTTRLEHEISSRMASASAATDSVTADESVGTGMSPDSVGDDSDDLVAEAILSTRNLADALRISESRAVSTGGDGGGDKKRAGSAPTTQQTPSGRTGNTALGFGADAIAESENMVCAIEQIRQSQA